MVYRAAGDHYEVVLCGRESPRLWALPKGGPDEGERLEGTALREVREETGLSTEIQAPLGKIQYWYTRSQDGVLCHKTVHFYLMVPTGGGLALHDPEFDYVQWFHEDVVADVMNYDTEIGIVKKALETVKNGSVPYEARDNPRR